MENELTKFFNQTHRRKFTFNDWNTWRKSKGLDELTNNEKLKFISQAKYIRSLDIEYVQHTDRCTYIFYYKNVKELNCLNEIPFYKK